MKLAELIAKRSVLMTEVQGILDKDGPTEDELKRAQTAQGEIRALDAKIDLVKGQEDLSARSTETLGVTAGDADTRSDGEGERVEGGEDRRLLDPKRGFRHGREFLQCAIRQLHPELRRRGPEDERLRLIREEEGRNAGSYPREDRAAGSDEQMAAADPYGGYLVPEGFLPGELSLAPPDDPLAGRTTVIPMSTPSIKAVARTDKDHTSSVSGGLTVSRRAETAAMSGSRQTREMVQLEATPLYGLNYVTEELLADSPISVAALIHAGFRDEFASHMVDERINGLGVGECLGVANSPAKITVAKENAQTADTIVTNNVLKMRARAWHYSDCVWMGNNDIYVQLASLTMVVATGGSMAFLMSLKEDIGETLLGRPLVLTEYCQTLGDAGDLILVNWTQYLDGVRQGLQSAESAHVRFEYNERVFRFTMRNGGAPWWKSALTPKNSTSTLSPIVYLAERA